MQFKSNIKMEDISRMAEIAEIYGITNQKEKSEEYLKIVIQMCDKYPKNENLLQVKMHSLNLLNKPYKSLETTNELLNINPYNLPALLNVAAYLRSD